ncbi:MAG: hypothetical protein KAJ40_00315 [Alphaproteobacteria bacterium]|nr:hypothetical protein [Alphaproteobacteria bacterium]
MVKNLRRKYSSILFIAICVSFVVVALSGISLSKAYAQSSNADQACDDGKYDPSDYKKWKETFKATPVEDMVFRKNKRGCAHRMAFTMVLIKHFKSGEGIDDIAKSPILGPYMNEQYDLIRAKGVTKAQKEMLESYQSCIKEAPEDEDPSEEYDLNMRYGACSKLDTILMDTVESIKNRRSINSVMSKYERSFPDLSETAYSEIEDPVPLFIGRLYQKAQSSEAEGQNKYDVLIEYASQLVLGCTL